MRKSFKTLTLSIMILVSMSFAQEKVNMDVVNKIMDHGFNKSQVMDIAWEITDGNGPRLTNSKGLERAQQTVMKMMKDWGLKNVELDEWGTFGKQWDTKKYSVELGVNESKPFKKQLDRAISNKNYDILEYLVYEKKGLFPFAVSSIFSPTVSYNNIPMNRILVNELHQYFHF